MTRLAAVLAGAWHSCRPTCEGETPAGHTCDLIAESVVAAIPEPERSALEAGLLLGEVHERWPGLWVEVLWSVPKGYWQAWATTQSGDSTTGIGDTPHAALAALLTKLGDAA